MTEWQSIETAPKDRRILAFGQLGFENEPGIGTVLWNDVRQCFHCDPNEATEYDYEACRLTHWMPLPAAP